MEKGWEATEVPQGGSRVCAALKVLSPCNRASPRQPRAHWPHPQLAISICKNTCLAPKEWAKTSQGLSPVITGGQSQSKSDL